MDNNSIKYLDRASGEIITETVMGDRALRFAYNTLLGRSLWAVLFGGKAVSALMGRYYDSPASRKDIAKLAAIPGCCPDEAEYPMEHYDSFNSFFARRLKPGARPVDNDEKVLTSPADGKIIVHTGLKPDAPIPVKGAKRSMKELCKTAALTRGPSTRPRAPILPMIEGIVMITSTSVQPPFIFSIYSSSPT